MLRITGALALLASATLAAVLLSRVRSYQGSGILTCTPAGTITVCLRDSLEFAPELVDYPPIRAMDPRTHVWEMKFPAVGGDVGLRGPTRVDLDFRLLALRWPRTILDGSSIRDDQQRSYPCTRPLLVFYAILALVALGPVLLWSLAAPLVAMTVRKRAPP